MRRVYWRPRRVSRTILALGAAVALLCLAAVEFFQIRSKQPHYREKMMAARLARDGLNLIRRERLQRGPSIDPETDPAGTGLLGFLMSPITTNVGHLPSKQTSTNPNFAAVVVQMLKRAGVGEGDVVAVGVSGSFPALNVSVLAAIEALRLQPILISSVTGSQWGANDPAFTWLDMETVLNDRGVLHTRSIAASPGGIEDRALGLSKANRQLVLDAIERNGIPLLRPKDYAESVESRWELYQERSGDRPIAAYINVGGGTASVGTRVGKRLFKAGLNRTAPPGSTRFDSVMTRFVKDDVPVLHLVKIQDLAARYGLSVEFTSLPDAGEGKVYFREQYSAPLAWAVLAGILAFLWVFVRSDLGFRVLQARRERRKRQPPEQMV